MKLLQADYKCTAGKLTIGYGRNLDDRGISAYEAGVLLARDIYDAKKDARTFLGGSFNRLEGPRYHAIVDMALNLGLTRLNKFKKLKAAIEEGDFDKAADEILDSNYAKQVGNRATRNIKLMREG